MSLQTCPQCQAEIVGRFHFCLECGAALELARSLTPPPMMEVQEEIQAPVFEMQPSHPAANVTPPPFELGEEELASEPLNHEEESAALEDLHIAPKPTPTPQKNYNEPKQIDYFDLTLIRSPDLDSVRFVVKDHSLIGREEGHLIFKDDPYISPLHATLFYRDGQLIIRDESSFNGVYVRLSDSKPLSVGETFIAGEQVFILEAEPRSVSIPSSQNDPKTRFFANSAKGILGYYLTQTLDGGQHGAVYPFIDSSITVGRQGCDVNAPLDRFMSSTHCQVSLINDEVILTDRGSKNGTFIKINGERTLNVGDYILIGKQLLQVQPHQPGSRSKVAI